MSHNVSAPSVNRRNARRHSALRTVVVKVVPPLAGAALLAVAACGGGGSGSTPAVSPAPIGTGTAVPTPSPGPTAVTVTPASLAFSGAGAGIAGQKVAVAQANNTAFSLATTTCAGIASVTPTSGAGPFTFSPLAAGTCSYIVSGTGGATAAVAITITTTTVVGQ